MKSASETSDFNLERFVEAQDGRYERALGELRAGRKSGHWIWFILPQHGALGRSDETRFYGVNTIAEARAYLTHPVLGPRLLACVEALLGHRGTSAETILGEVDAMKLRSSMTLFEAAADRPEPFAAVLDAFHAGARDQRTLALLEEAPVLAEAPAEAEPLASPLSGHCLCGAVRITVEALKPQVDVCHCTMCLRWGGGAFAGVSGGAFTLEGEEQVRVYRSSDWAERAFCGVCGSNLWYRFVPANHHSFLAGLFDLPDGATMWRQIFIDEKPSWYDFVQDTPKMTAAEVIADAKAKGVDLSGV